MISFKKLFQPHKAPDDDLTQAQREAIVDLLNYCSFLGNKITATEGDLIDSLESQLHWDENTDFDYYENKSVGLVRGVLDTPGAIDNFLKGVRARLDTEKSRAIALGLVEKIVKVSGKTSPEESQAWVAISSLLK